MTNAEESSETMEVDANDSHALPRRMVHEMPSSSLTKITRPFFGLLKRRSNGVSMGMKICRSE